MTAGECTAVNVRFFASLREAVGRDGVELALDRATVAGVRDRLRGVLGPAGMQAISAAGVQVAVNHAIVADDVRLAAGDEVAFLPPVTGG